MVYGQPALAVRALAVSLFRVDSGRGQNRTLRLLWRFGHRYSPVSRMWAHPEGEMWARSSGSTLSPACFRCLTASPRWAVFQRLSASGTRRETGPQPDALRPGRSDGKAVLQYPRHLRRIRSRSHPHSHPLGHGHRPRQGEIARQAAQTVRQTAAGTLPLACQGRIFHQRSHRAFLRLKTNRLSNTQPAPFPLAYDPAPYRNRPVSRL